MKRSCKLLLAVAGTALFMANANADVPANHSQFIASMTQEMRTIGTNMVLLNQRVVKIEPNAKLQAESDLVNLRWKYQYTSDQLNSLMQQAGDAWDNAQASFLHVIQTLNDTYKDVDAEFTEDGV